jgi:dTDP-4-dehydrorhamnose reductase
MGKLKPLILGDGLLGSEIVKQTNWDYVSRKKNGFQTTSNFEDFLVVDGNPISDTIVNCIANTDTYSLDKELHWEVNYVFLHKLILFCNKYNIKLIHISTDYIYTGSVTNATENDVPVHCNNWYGYTKLLGDGLVQLLSAKYLLLRCTHKPKPFPYEKAWIDQVGNFDYVDRISEIIIKMIRSDVTGLYNVGTNLKSMYELAMETSEVTPAISDSHIPKNLSMSLESLKKLKNCL